jgi:4-alpha-glucanotransferase
VSIFFADLFGMREMYNEPGVVAESNWRLRVPPHYEERYATSLRTDSGPQALDLMRALLLALRAKRVGDEALLARVEAFVA